MAMPTYAKRGLLGDRPHTAASKADHPHRAKSSTADLNSLAGRIALRLHGASIRYRFMETALSASDFTLATDSAVTVHNMGDDQLILSQVNEATGKTERVAISVGELQTLLETLASQRPTETKNTDRTLVPA